MVADGVELSLEGGHEGIVRRCIRRRRGREGALLSLGKLDAEHSSDLGRRFRLRVKDVTRRME